MKTRKKYRSLLLTLLLCLSLTACGSPDGDIAGGDWRTTGAVDAYGTVARDAAMKKLSALLLSLLLLLTACGTPATPGDAVTLTRETT